MRSGTSAGAIVGAGGVAAGGGSSRVSGVTAWVHDHADQIELCYLPSYAPEHNPDEFLNNDLKQAMARRRTPRDKTALKSGLTSYMPSLQRCPAKVRTFLQAPTVRYAA